jgi:outer membrane protein assembly factor BamB
MGNAGADGVVRRCRTDDGTEIWNSHPLGSLRNAPVVINGRVFVGLDTVGVLDARSGTLVRTIELGGRGQSLAVAHPDAVVVVDESGFMQALVP